MAAGDECKGCIFAGQRNSVCDRANEIAVAADLPDCMDISPDGRDYIYVLDTSDPRQIDLLKHQSGAGAVAAEPTPEQNP